MTVGVNTSTSGSIPVRASSRACGAVGVSRHATVLYDHGRTGTRRVVRALGSFKRGKDIERLGVDGSVGAGVASVFGFAGAAVSGIGVGRFVVVGGGVVSFWNVAGGDAGAGVVGKAGCGVGEPIMPGDVIGTVFKWLGEA